MLPRSPLLGFPFLKLHSLTYSLSFASHPTDQIVTYSVVLFLLLPRQLRQ